MELLGPIGDLVKFLRPANAVAGVGDAAKADDAALKLADQSGAARKTSAGADDVTPPVRIDSRQRQADRTSRSGREQGRSFDRPSARAVHDQYVRKVRPGAKERVFETPWSQGKGLGGRKFDDFDDATGTAFEANTTPWSQMTQEQLSRKLDQVGADLAILRQKNGPVKRIVWFGTEQLPKGGLGGQLREALQKAGIEYWVVTP